MMSIGEASRFTELSNCLLLYMIAQKGSADDTSYLFASSYIIVYHGSENDAVQP